MIWGGATKLASEHEMIQEKIKMAKHTGIEVVACKGCSDQLGVSELLTKVGVDVKYIGTDLTDILKDDEKLLTI